MTINLKLIFMKNCSLYLLCLIAICCTSCNLNLESRCSNLITSIEECGGSIDSSKFANFSKKIEELKEDFGNNFESYTENEQLLINTTIEKAYLLLIDAKLNDIERYVKQVEISKVRYTDLDWQKSDQRYAEMISSLLNEFGGVFTAEQKDKLYQLEKKYNTLRPMSMEGALEVIGNEINGFINVVESFFK
jgi:hypothetical protein